MPGEVRLKISALYFTLNVVENQLNYIEVIVVEILHQTPYQCKILEMNLLF